MHNDLRGEHLNYFPLPVLFFAFLVRPVFDLIGKQAVIDVFRKKDFYGFLIVFLDYKSFSPKVFEIFASEMPSLYLSQDGGCCFESCPRTLIHTITVTKSSNFPFQA